MKYCDSRIIYNLQPEWKWHIFLLRKQQVCHQTEPLKPCNLNFVLMNNKLWSCGPGDLGLMIKHFNSF